MFGHAHLHHCTNTPILHRNYAFSVLLLPLSRTFTFAHRINHLVIILTLVVLQAYALDINMLFIVYLHTFIHLSTFMYNAHQRHQNTIMLSDHFSEEVHALDAAPSPWHLTTIMTLKDVQTDKNMSWPPAEAVLRSVSELP